MDPGRACRLNSSLVAVCLGAIGTAAFADDQAVKEELKRHQGTWSVTSSIYDGEPASEELLRTIQRTVTGDHVVWERNGKRFAGTRIELDPARTPRTIDVIPDGGRSRGERVLGIYKLEGDQLTIAMAAPGQPRPTEFRAAKGSGWTLRTFRRERPSVRDRDRAGPAATRPGPSR
jgi:uncharacterized protein (TIGR03067 family)